MQRFKNAYSKTKTYLDERQEWKHLNGIHEKYREFTMIPRNLYRANLQLAQKFQEVEGAVVECGTWKGGMIAGMAEILGPNRSYYLYDSFEGLPEAGEIDGKGAKAWQEDTESPQYFDNCTADYQDAQTAMKKSPAQEVTIEKGWFSDTLPHYAGPPIAILRLDGDWYESTMQGLENLFPHLVEGGVVILDDYYHWSGCSRALHDYLSQTKSCSRIHQFQDQILAYVVKNESDSF
ncbi:MAG: TylF/MycF/NovP-related O-methyltransferase [Bacteroidota bacterium]